jgi:Tfp pilus assembly protein PilN
MKTINLLPPEEFERLGARRLRTRLVLIGLIYLVGLAGLTLWWNNRVADAEAEVTVQQERNLDLQAEVQSLSEAEQLVEAYDGNVLLVADALQRDMSWGRLLNDLARMIPDRVWLESFAGAVGDDAEGVLGSVTVAGVAFSYPDVSAWLRSLDSDRFPGVEGTWVQTISDSLIGEAELVGFSSTTSLTESALANRLDERVPLVIP